MAIKKRSIGKKRATNKGKVRSRKDLAEKLSRRVYGGKLKGSRETVITGGGKKSTGGLSITTIAIGIGIVAIIWFGRT